MDQSSRATSEDKWKWIGFFNCFGLLIGARLSGQLTYTRQWRALPCGRNIASTNGCSVFWRGEGFGCSEHGHCSTRLASTCMCSDYCKHPASTNGCSVFWRGEGFGCSEHDYCLTRLASTYMCSDYCKYPASTYYIGAQYFRMVLVWMQRAHPLIRASSRAHPCAQK
ncbi:hypothetical protein SASPL_135370 [Salvia splendens]|uniref:Uncharacterized protein n=1 Tax=Salvia splendens TaxID=180675 RepID=A0A8X8ZFW6_SALSN|nr:hypothetical protein SASPL_135370 [Salvia splendens]